MQHLAELKPDVVTVGKVIPTHRHLDTLMLAYTTGSCGEKAAISYMHTIWQYNYWGNTFLTIKSTKMLVEHMNKLS